MTSGDVMEAYDLAMDAAIRLNKADDVTEQIRQLVEAKDNSGTQNAASQFVRQALCSRMPDCGNDISPVA